MCQAQFVAEMFFHRICISQCCLMLMLLDIAFTAMSLSFVTTLNATREIQNKFITYMTLHTCIMNAFLSHGEIQVYVTS